ncbi:hypothetical protein Bca101_059259 [Brassica carinata]
MREHCKRRLPERQVSQWEEGNMTISLASEIPSAETRRGNAENMMNQILRCQFKMVDDFRRKLDATYTQINNSIRWVSDPSGDAGTSSGWD